MTTLRAIAPYLTRPRWTSEDAGAALTALSASGLSVAAFAAREGLDPQRLYLWRRKFVGKAKSMSRPRFVEVRARAVERIEVVLSSGDVLRVPESFEAETLRRVIEVLEPSRSC
jgi:transposase-like protein